MITIFVIARDKLDAQRTHPHAVYLKDPHQLKNKGPHNARVLLTPSAAWHPQFHVLLHAARVRNLQEGHPDKDLKPRAADPAPQRRRHDDPPTGGGDPPATL